MLVMIIMMTLLIMIIMVKTMSIITKGTLKGEEEEALIRKRKKRKMSGKTFRQQTTFRLLRSTENRSYQRKGRSFNGSRGRKTANSAVNRLPDLELVSQNSTTVRPTA